MTNITDFDPTTGRTTTTLVDDHDRGAVDFNTTEGQTHDTWHRWEGGGGGSEDVGTLDIDLVGGWLTVLWDNAALRAEGEHTFRTRLNYLMATPPDEDTWTQDVDDRWGELLVRYSVVPPTPDKPLWRGPYDLQSVDAPRLKAAASTVFDVTFQPTPAEATSGDNLIIEPPHDDLIDPVGMATFIALFAANVPPVANWKDGQYHDVPMGLATGSSVGIAANNYPSAAPTKTALGYEGFPYLAGSLNTCFMAAEYLFLDGVTTRMRYTNRWEIEAVNVIGAHPDAANNTYCYLDTEFTGWNKAAGTSITAPCRKAPAATAANFTKPVRVGTLQSDRGPLYKPGGTVVVTPAQLFSLAGQTVTVQNVGGKMTLNAPTLP